MIGRRRFMGQGLGAVLGAGLASWIAGAAESLAAVDSVALLREARRIFEQNRVRSAEGVFHLPSAETYRAFFAWDSGWNAIGLSCLDPGQALEELQTVFALQADDVHVPHEVRIPGLEETDPVRKAVIYLVRRQYDDEGRSRFIDPPSFLMAAGLLFEKTGDQRVLALLPAMERCAEYLTGPRDLFGDGLVSIIHPWESGTDSAPVFDAPIHADVNSPLFALQYAEKYPALLNHCARLDWDLARIARSNRFVFEDVGMNSITAAGLMSMAKLLRAAGDSGKAEKWDARARAMAAAMEEIFWDDDAGFFFPRYDLQKRLSSKRTCLTGLMPLITGAVSKDKAERVIEELLLSPRCFKGPWLVPFNSIEEMAGENIPMEGAMLWRGRCIWINMNWLAARAAAKYGREDVAREITASTAKMVSREGFREFYDPHTGKGGGAGGFTWPALVLDMMERYGL